MLTYTVQNLGEIGFVIDMNNSGQLAGYTSSAQSLEAFLYSDGTSSILGILPGFTRSTANAINNLGDVVGGCDMPSSSSYSRGHAFLYHNGLMTDLHPSLQAAGYSDSVASDINDKGMIVGDGNLGPWLLWDGKVTILRQEPGVPPNVMSPLINNSGVVAFGTEYSSGLYRYDSNTHLGQYLGTFGADVRLDPPSEINDSGQIVGIYQAKNTAGAPFQAYLYTQSLQALGVKVDDYEHETPDLNSQGQMVFGTQFLYDNGIMTNLQSVLPPRFLARVGPYWGAYLINDGGQLICYGYPALSSDVYLLTPITPQRLSLDKIADLAAYVHVLIGVVEGGGGVVILPGGSILRISPVGPPPGDPLTGTVLGLLARLASGLAVRESASTIPESKLRADVETAAAKSIRASLRDALAVLENQASEEKV